MSALVGGVGGAIIGGSVIGGGLGLIGSGMQSSAAQNAAQIQADAANRASQLQYQEYQQTRDDQQPWRQAGAQALSQMADPSFQHSFSGADFQTDPGYQFRMQQGQDALERSAAARGGLSSGGTLKALTQYGQDYASNEYQNAYNRFTNDQSNRFNRLASVAGVGQTANGMTAQAGMNYANNAGQNIMGAGNAAAGAQMAQGQQWGSTLSSLGSGLGNTWMQYQALSKNPLYNMPMPGGGGGAGYGGFNFNGDNSGGYQMPTFGSGLG